ncbi:MFS transporter [bacterium SCSIO 12643]|nr:MFS transporter [bacterium SCSIO 12643]
MITGEIVFLLPFVVIRIFRPTFLKVFEISNLELGSAFSVYGIIAMISYFWGGPIADRFTAKKLIIISLLLTAMGGLYMALIPSISGMVVLYAFWGMSTILLYWAASIKAIRTFGGEQTQGWAFGMVDGGRGLIAAILGSVSVLLFDTFLTVEAEQATLTDLSKALSQIIYLFIGLVVFSVFLVWMVFPQEKESKNIGPKLSLKGVLAALKHRTIWLQGFIILCAYVGYKTTDDFSLYASDVLGYDDVKAARLATLSFWVRPIAAFGIGWLGDKWKASRAVNISFAVIVLGSVILASGRLKDSIGLWIIVTIALTSIGIYGLRGVYFALFKEADVPIKYIGSAAGVVSLIGYTPDVFFGPLMGYILDRSPGIAGHQHLFMVLTGFALLGWIASILFQKNVAKQST